MVIDMVSFRVAFVGRLGKFETGEEYRFCSSSASAFGSGRVVRSESVRRALLIFERVTLGVGVARCRPPFSRFGRTRRIDRSQQTFFRVYTSDWRDSLAAETQRVSLTFSGTHHVLFRETPIRLRPINYWLRCGLGAAGHRCQDPRFAMSSTTIAGLSNHHYHKHAR